MAADTEPLEILLHLPLLAEDKVLSPFLLVFSVISFFIKKISFSSARICDFNVGGAYHWFSVVFL